MLLVAIVEDGPRFFKFSMLPTHGCVKMLTELKVIPEPQVESGDRYLPRCSSATWVLSCALRPPGAVGLLGCRLQES